MLHPSGAAMSKSKIELSPADMSELCRRYAADRASLESFYFIDTAESRLRRLEDFSKDWLERLKGVDFDALEQSGKIDYILLRNENEYLIKKVGFERARNRETEALLPFAPKIIGMEEKRWKIEPVDPEKAAGDIDALAKEIKEQRKKVQEALDKAKDKPQDPKPKSLDPVLAFRASKEAKELSDTFEKWFKHYDGFKPLFSWWCRKPYEAAKKELDDYTKFLKETVAGVKEGEDDPLIGDPIGKEELQAELDHEMIPYTLEELVKIAEREYAWCEAEMKKAAAEMGEKDWKKALEKVKQNHAPPGEQDNLVADQAREAVAFLDKRDLVTIEPLCRETWRVDMMDAKQQRSLPFAAYGGQKMLVSFPLDTMDHETKEMSLRGNNIHFTRAITFHELIPGHHLQSYMAQRYNAHRQVFSTPFLTEGWALYWELLLYDMGFPRGPEDRIGMLFWRMHRAARIIVSLNFHLGKMKPQEMIDYLIEKVGQERWTATSEVRRFIGGAYSPLYQSAYMIGGLQLRALAREMERGMGTLDSSSPRSNLEPPNRQKPTAKYPASKAFHDAVLRENSMPIELIRAALMGTKLTRGYKASWRFH